MALDIRPWRPGDEAAILALFEAVFGRPMTPAFWRWRFLDHPAGGPLVALAWDGDRLAAHYAASQGPLCVDGETVPAALSMTTMTHPDHRGRGLFETLGGALYETLAADGFAMVWGFPNAVSHVPFRAKLGWFDLADVATMTLDLGGAGAPRAADPAVAEAAAVDARFARLCARLARQTPVGAARDAAILAWRVDRNPVNRYRRLVVEDGAEIAGYAILKPWGEDVVDLVELRAEDDAAARALLGAAAAAAAAEGRRRVLAWRPPGDAQRLVFERSGFVAGGPVTYWGGRAFPAAPADAGLDDPRRWRLSMLDSDLY